MKYKIQILISLVLLTACQKQIKQAKENAHIPEQFSKTIQDYVNDPSKSVEELEKLNQIEYKVFSVPLEASNTKLEQALNDMGSRRWDCFHAENLKTANESETKILFFCKRMPETILRYIPRSLIGR